MGTLAEEIQDQEIQPFAAASGQNQKNQVNA
jgi:hypothetical protein